MAETSEAAEFLAGVLRSTTAEAASRAGLKQGRIEVGLELEQGILDSGGVGRARSISKGSWPRLEERKLARRQKRAAEGDIATMVVVEATEKWWRGGRKHLLEMKVC